jgi:hypothetical protein
VIGGSGVFAKRQRSSDLESLGDKAVDIKNAGSA